MADEQAQISWLALQKGTRVVASDGSEVGRVSDVVADREKDIFSGIAFRDGLLGTERFAPADAVGEITDDAVHLSLSPDEAGSLEEPAS